MIIQIDAHIDDAARFSVELDPTADEENPPEELFIKIEDYPDDEGGFERQVLLSEEEARALFCWLGRALGGVA